jgi:hypothetical protein
MKVAATFSVSENEIRNICRLKEIPFSGRLIMDAKRELESYRKHFDDSIETIDVTFSTAFRMLDLAKVSVDVLIFPKSVEMGAVNCERKAIYFGIRKRIRMLDTAMICHEISHILLYPRRKDGSLGRFADEAFSYLVENEILSRLAGRKYFSVWKKDSLDDYHRISFGLAERELPEWSRYLDGKISGESFLRNLIDHAPKEEASRKYRLKDFLAR